MSRGQRRLLRIGEVCDYLGVSRTTVLAAEEAGLLAPVRTVGGHRRYDREQLDAFLTQNRTLPTITPEPVPPSPTSDDTAPQAAAGQQQLLIRSALRQLVILLNADAAGLYLVTQGGGLQLNASFGIPRWLMAQLSQHPPIEPVMRAVAAQRREVIDTDPRRFPGPAFEGQQVAIPLHWNDALLGSLFVVSGRDRSFFPSEIQMIETGAFFLGIIAGQQRLIETLECRLSQVRRLSTVDETEGDTRGD